MFATSLSTLLYVQILMYYMSFPLKYRFFDKVIEQRYIILVSWHKADVDLRPLSTVGVQYIERVQYNFDWTTISIKMLCQIIPCFDRIDSKIYFKYFYYTYICILYFLINTNVPFTYIVEQKYILCDFLISPYVLYIV